MTDRPRLAIARLLLSELRPGEPYLTTGELTLGTDGVDAVVRDLLAHRDIIMAVHHSIAEVEYPRTQECLSLAAEQVRQAVDAAMELRDHVEKAVCELHDASDVMREERERIWGKDADE